MGSEDAETLEPIVLKDGADLERMPIFRYNESLFWLTFHQSPRLSVARNWQGYDGPKVRHLSFLNCRSNLFIAPSSGLNGGIKIRPNAEDLEDIGSVFEERWKSYFANAPDKPVSWIGITSA